MRKIILFILFLIPAILVLTPFKSVGSENTPFVVYSVFRGLNMGDPMEHSLKDYYVNMGTQQGVRPGTTLEVMRKISTYDLMSKKLHGDVAFPIARLKVIHVEQGSAIARLEVMLPKDKTPSVTNDTVMVGDLVRILQK